MASLEAAGDPEINKLLDAYQTQAPNVEVPPLTLPQLDYRFVLSAVGATVHVTKGVHEALGLMPLDEVDVVAGNTLSRTAERSPDDQEGSEWPWVNVIISDPSYAPAIAGAIRPGSHFSERQGWAIGVGPSHVDAVVSLAARMDLKTVDNKLEFERFVPFHKRTAVARRLEEPYGFASVLGEALKNVVTTAVGPALKVHNKVTEENGGGTGGKRPDTYEHAAKIGEAVSASFFDEYIPELKAIPVMRIRQAP